MKRTNINLLIFIGTLIFWTVLGLLTPIQQLQTEYQNQAKISFDSNSSTANKQEIEKLYTQFKESSTLETFGIAIAVYGGILLIGYLVMNERFRNRKFYIQALANSILATLLAGVYYSLTIGFDQEYFSSYTNYYFPIKGLITTLLAYQLFRYIFKTYFLGEEPRIIHDRLELFTDTPNWLFTTLVVATGLLTGVFLDPMEQINWMIKYFA